MYAIVFEEAAYLDVEQAITYYRLEAGESVAQQFEGALSDAVNFLITNAHTPQKRIHEARFQQL